MQQETKTKATANQLIYSGFLVLGAGLEPAQP